MAIYNSGAETIFTKEDFDTLHSCIILAMQIGEQVGLDLHFKRNVPDREFLDELRTSLEQINERLIHGSKPSSK